MVEGLQTELDLQVKDHLISTFTEHSKLIDVSANEIVQELLKELIKPPQHSTIRINDMKYTNKEAITSINTMFHKVYNERGVPSPPDVHHILSDVVVIENIHQLIVPCGHQVIIDKDCGCAVMRGADVFTPGILAAPKGVCKGDRVAVFADIDGNCLKGVASEYKGRVLFVGNGSLLQDRHDWFGQASINKGVAINMTHPLYVSPRLVNLSCDMFYPQNLPSSIVSHVLNPQPGDVVLDMCASPGGKTSHIASLMKDSGCVIAIDKTSRKVARLQKTIDLFKLTCVHCYEYDSTHLMQSEQAGSIPGPPPYMPGTFDKVLLDGPCSGLGQRPCIRYSLKISEVLSYQKYQRKLIRQAIGLLRVGGTLVYSTCTVLPQENEEQVHWILTEFPSMVLNKQEPLLGYPGLPLFGLSDNQCLHLQRFGPRNVYHNFIFKDHKYKTDGIVLQTDTICFFIASFTKQQ